MIREAIDRRGGGRKIASTLLTIAVLLGLCASPSAAIETDTFRVDPFPVAIQGLERRTFAFDLEPGDVATDAVEIENLTDEPRRFRLYPTDVAEDRQTGDLDVRPRTIEPVGVGSWVDLETTEFELAPRSSIVVPFTVERPSGTGTAGLGAVVAEELLDDPVTGGISVVYRLALLIRLGGDVSGMQVGAPYLDAGPQIFPGHADVGVDVTNETLQTARLTVAFTSAGLSGRIWDVADVHVELAPGERRRIEARWTTVPRWGGAFRPAASVAWEGGSIVRTGPRALHPPLWLLALAILLIGVRATRELRAGRGAADDRPDLLTLKDELGPELTATGDRT